MRDSFLLGVEPLISALTSLLHCRPSTSTISPSAGRCHTTTSFPGAACNGKQSALLSLTTFFGFKVRGVKSLLSFWRPKFLFTVLDSDVKGTDSDVKGTDSDVKDLLGSKTRVVLTKKDFFSEEISLGSDGMLMIARGKMRP